MNKLYIFVRTEIYPHITDVKMTCPDGLFLLPVVQGWFARNCPAGTRWRKYRYHKMILMTIKQIDKDITDDLEERKADC